MIASRTKEAALLKARWLMCATVLVDFTLTLLGQPTSYWADPSTAQEYNKLFKLVMNSGCWLFIAFVFSYIVFWFFFVSYANRAIAYIAFYGLTLGHYFGASSWICYYYKLGVTGPVIYAILIGAALVALDIPPKQKPPNGNN